LEDLNLEGTNVKEQHFTIGTKFLDHPEGKLLNGTNSENEKNDQKKIQKKLPKEKPKLHNKKLKKLQILNLLLYYYILHISQNMKNT
jgi:hypothetical protein